MRKFSVAALVVSVVSGFAGPTAAAVLVATYSGAIGAGSLDRDQVFSDGAQSLVGRRFSLAFVFDTELGIRSEDDVNVNLYGGTLLDVMDDPPHVNSPISRVTLTVAGVTRTYGGNTYGAIARTIELYRLSHLYSQAGVSISGMLMNPAGAPGRDLDRLVDYTGFGVGYFRQGYIGEFDSYATDLRLGADHLTVAAAAAAPEPKTWVILMIGFGAAGALLRHRRQRTRSNSLVN